MSHILVPVGIIGLCALLAGLVHRRLYRACFSFLAYAVAVLVSETLIFLWPARFYVWGFWMGKELLFALLKIAMALEIAALSFAAFPGARAMSRWVIPPILIGTAVAGGGAFYSAKTLMESAQALHSSLANGTALLLVAVWVVILYCRLPLHPFHRALLRGLVLYVAIFALMLGLLRDLGERVWAWTALADGGAYLLVAYWTWFVWTYREGTPTDLHLRLQPWRARL